MIRYYYLGLMVKSDDRVAMHASPTTLRKVWLVSLLTTIVPLVYVLAPVWLGWAALPLPGGLRWLGLGLGLLSIPLLLWIHRALGRGFDLPGIIKEKQTLIAEGPYRWVRHPMYTTFALFSLAGFLVSANWFVGAVLLSYCLAAFSMTSMEEATLLEKFGETYQAYIRRTGRFLPRIR